MNHFSKERAALYATDSDFCRIFKEDMQSLYLLSLLLTADPEKAEQCYISGLNDCSEGNKVFKEWAKSWARRVVIKNAIRAISPAMAHQEDSEDDVPTLSDQSTVLVRAELPAELSAVMELPRMERFAFVMSFCEGYSDHDCALLLGCMRADVAAARVHALQRIGRPEQIHKRITTESVLQPTPDLSEAVAVPA
jgi:hypothetical protein